MAPPSTRSSVSAMPESGRHRLDQLRALEGDRLERGAREVRPRGAARDARRSCRARADPSTARPGPRAPARSRRRRCRARSPRAPRRRRRAAMMPRPSRSHWIAAPAMKTLPSSAYARAPAALPRHRGEQAVARGGGLRRRCSSAGSSRCRRCSSPCPGAWHAWPKSAACWSPAMPAIGDARRAGPRTRCAQTRRSNRRTSRQHARAGCRGARAARRPSRSVWMLKSSVREALVTSVTCARAAGELPGEPGVDGAEGELAALGALARARHVVEQPGELGAREVGVEHEARSARANSGSCPACRRASHRDAVRRSCHTIALATGRPGGAVPERRWSRAGW